MMKAIVNGVFLLGDQEVTGGALLFDEAIIGHVPESGLPEGYEVIDAGGCYVSPGLMDLHIHGYLNEDASDGNAEGIRLIAKALLENGVTSFLPTTMTVSWAEIEAAFDVIRALKKESGQPGFEGAQVLGAHAEGPFINPKRKGAQSEEAILPPDADKVLRHKDIIRILTMAPEMPGGLEMIKSVTEQSDIVVSIGHTNASFEQALEAIEAGASYITHLFNAMSPLNHRNPGVVGAALQTPVTTELIADTFHVHPGLFAFLHGLKQDKLVLVTDCTRAGGLGDGEYTLGGQRIFVNGIQCRLADGTIAGSVLKLNEAVRNLRGHANLNTAQAVAAASLHPAFAIGAQDKKGSLEAGKDADIVLFDRDMNARAVYIAGRLKYKKEG
ncbi:MAG TPA: N-acetylglucosamine-6-phosphate deacetylase [Clostridia bacterium]|nr:N-acetylglucosamine-6-phosphate deacetylase [Clostridia bacterium]